MPELNWIDDLLNMLECGLTDYEYMIKEITRRHHKYTLRGKSKTESEIIVRKYLLG